MSLYPCDVWDGKKSHPILPAYNAHPSWLNSMRCTLASTTFCITTTSSVVTTWTKTGSYIKSELKLNWKTIGLGSTRESVQNSINKKNQQNWKLYEHRHNVHHALITNEINLAITILVIRFLQCNILMFLILNIIEIIALLQPKTKKNRKTLLKITNRQNSGAT